MNLTSEEYREQELIKKLTMLIWRDDVLEISEILKYDKDIIKKHCYSIKDSCNDNIEIPTSGLGIMHLAAFADSLSCFLLLLKEGIPIGQYSINSDDPLIYAVYNNSLEVSTFIIAHDPLQVERLRPFSLLRASLRAENNELTHKLLINGAPVDNMAISDAIVRNNAEVLIEFIDRTNYNQNIFGTLSPVQFACLNGEVEILRFLINRGYPFLTPNEKGLTAFHIACYLNNLECAEVFLGLINFGTQLQGKYQAIHSAVMTLNPDFVSHVIELGAQVNVFDEDGFPAAHLIYQHTKEVDKVIAIYEILHEHGYDFNMLPKNKKSCWSLLPTVIVSMTRNPIIISWLIDHDSWIDQTIVLPNGKIISVKHTIEQMSNTNRLVKEALIRYKARVY